MKFGLNIIIRSEIFNPLIRYSQKGDGFMGKLKDLKEKLKKGVKKVGKKGAKKETEKVTEEVAEEA